MGVELGSAFSVRSADVFYSKTLVSVQQGVSFREPAPHLVLLCCFKASQESSEDLYPSNYAPGPTHTPSSFVPVFVFICIDLDLNSLADKRVTVYGCVDKVNRLFGLQKPGHFSTMYLQSPAESSYNCSHSFLFFFQAT